MKKTIYIILTVLFIVGCQSQPTTSNPASIATNNKASSSQQAKVAKAFSDAKALQASHSKWFNRIEKLPLTIITTAYIDPEVLKTKEYKAYKILVRKIQKNPSILGKDIASKYSSITFLDYSTSRDVQNKFNAAYTNRYSDKIILTDILRPDTEKPSQELLLRLNYKELKKGNLTIEGYKTVKQKDKKRNSYYYTLRKKNYKDLTKKQKNQAIINSLKATLQLSIPEYVSIDRKDLIGENETIKYINQIDAQHMQMISYITPSTDVVSVLKKDIENIKNQSVSLKKMLTSKYPLNSFDVNDEFIVTGDRKSNLALYNLKSLKLIDTQNTKQFFILKVNFENYNNFSSVGGANDLHGRKATQSKINYNNRVITLSEGGLSESRVLYKNGKVAGTFIAGSDGKIIYADKYEAVDTLGGFSSGHKGWINTLDLIQEENTTLLVSGGSDSKVILWNVNTMSEMKTFTEHTGKVWGVKFINLMNFLSVGDDKVMRKFSINSTKSLMKFKGHTKPIRCLDVSKDGRFALTGDDAGVVIYWDLKTGKKLRTINAHSGTVSGVKFINSKSYNDAIYIASSSNDKSLKIWNLSKVSSKNQKKINKITATIKDIQSKQGYVKQENETKQILLTSSFSVRDIDILFHTMNIKTKDITLHNLDEIGQSLDYKFHDAITYNLYSKYESISDYKQILNVASYTYKTELDIQDVVFQSNYDYESNGYKVSFMQPIAKQKINIYTNVATILGSLKIDDNLVSFSKNKEFMLYAKENSYVIELWNVTKMKKIKTWELKREFVTSVSISQDGTRALASSAYKLYKFDLKTKDMKRFYRLIDAEKGLFSAVYIGDGFGVYGSSTGHIGKYVSNRIEHYLTKVNKSEISKVGVIKSNNKMYFEDFSQKRFVVESLDRGKTSSHIEDVPGNVYGKTVYTYEKEAKVRRIKNKEIVDASVLDKSIVDFINK